MKALTTAVMAGLVACAGTYGIASAQQYGYPYPYANNYGQAYGNQTIRGTIVAVNGDQVTLRLRGNAYGRNRNHQDGDEDRDDNGGGDRNNGGYYGNGDNGGYYGNGENGGYYGNGDNGGYYGNGESGGYYGNGNRNDGRYYRRGGREITINDRLALDNRTTGRVAVGRTVTARGYWQNGVFYAVALY